MGPSFIRNLFQSSNESHYKVRWCEIQGNVGLNRWLTNQMQLLSTVVPTGLETIDILTIFLEQSELILAKEIPLSLSMFTSSNISRSTHCSALMRYRPVIFPTLYIVHKKHNHSNYKLYHLPLNLICHPCMWTKKRWNSHASKTNLEDHLLAAGPS